jgi:hypothetical protein
MFMPAFAPAHGPLSRALIGCISVLVMIGGPPTIAVAQAPGRHLVQSVAIDTPTASLPVADAASPPDQAAPAAAPAGVSVAPVSSRPADPGAQAAPPRKPAPPLIFNRLAVPALGINSGLVNLSDCGNAAAIPRVGAAHLLCFDRSLVYIAGHSPGPFSSLSRAHPGEAVDYWDSSGTLTVYSVRSVELISRLDDDEAISGPLPQLVMQTCATPDGSMIWVVKASPA